MHQTGWKMLPKFAAKKICGKCIWGAYGQNSVGNSVVFTLKFSKVLFKKTKKHNNKTFLYFVVGNLPKVS